MSKYEDLRQYLSNFLAGPNIDAIINSLADEMQRQEDLSITVNDQLTVSTASDIYLDKRLSELGITRPAELGMDDLAFRQMGIQINATKQITEVIHTVLSTFYGDETTRALTTSNISGPYSFEDGDDLIFQLEDGIVHILTLSTSDFNSIQNAEVEEIVDIITRFIRERGYNGYAQVYLDVDTGEKHVRIFGGAKGPYSFVKILGGKIQNKLEFPEIRPTELPSNTTVWEITRNIGSTHRFRWVSGPQPALDKIVPNDKVMIYGNQFGQVGINGTFDVTSVRPAQAAPATNAGYFEIAIDEFNALTSSAIDQNPPPNTINNIYSFTLTQSSFDDLKFFLSKKNTSYSKNRYALAWEPESNLLKVYMPATTRVVRRDLEGSAHIHLLYKSTELNGAFGSLTEEESKIQILSDRSFSYKQNGFDVLAYGGIVNIISPFLATLDIDYIYREGQRTFVFTKVPHGLTGTIDQFGREISNAQVSVTVNSLPQDDINNEFKGPYIVDPEANYTLTDRYVTIRERILASESKKTLLVKGVVPNEEGLILFSLNNDNEEGPVKYFAAQAAATSSNILISTISQVGTNVTVVTSTPHGLTISDNILISGTSNFNGTWTILTTPSPNILQFYKSPSATLFETSGTILPLLDDVITTIILDPAYKFKFTHETDSDITIVSSNRPYDPELDGTDYPFYTTGTSEGRVFAENLIEQITALGINLEIIITYPSDIGLGNQGLSDSELDPPASEKIYVWGGD